MFSKRSTPPSRPAVPRDAESRTREPPSSYHDSSLDLAGGLDVSDGTVSALPEELQQALARLRQASKKPPVR
jgi:hypothetical protein